MHVEKRLAINFTATAVGLLAITLLFAGCQSIEHSLSISPAVPLVGTVHGGDQPVSGAKLQLYAAGTTGNSSAAQPLLKEPVTTGVDGSFSITGAYTCPSASSVIYLAATGGVAVAGGKDNPALSLMTVLGECGQLTSASNFEINEVTTVAATSGLRGYMSSLANLGAPAGDGAFLEDVGKEEELVNIATGTSPGTTVPAGYEVQVGKLYALADILAACINSNGGSAGDGSPCGNLFESVRPSVAGKAPTTAVSAALWIAQTPTYNVDEIYKLLPAASNPFAPTITTAPRDWTLSLLQLPAAPVISPAAGTYAAGQQVTLSTSTSGAAIYYTTDGSQPTTSSLVYGAPLKLTGSETINAISANSGLVSSVASTKYTVTTSHLVFATQPSTSTVSTPFSPAPVVEVIDDLSGKVVTSATAPVTVALSANPGHSSLTGATIAIPANGIATFPNLSITEPANGYSLEATATGMASVLSSSFDIADLKLGIVISKPSLSVGNSSTGTVNLGAPLMIAVTITLSSSAPSQVTVTPSAVTIPAGATSASFAYNAVAAGNATITAAATGVSSASAGVTVTPAPLIALQLANGNPVSGAASSGTISLSAPTPTNLSVALSSSSPSTVSVTPATIALPAGATSGSFTYSANSAGTATISATATDYTSGSASVKVAAIPVIALSLPNAAPSAGMTLTGNISLSSPPSAPIVLSVVSSSPALVSITPASVTIPAGSSSGMFSYTALAPGSSTITATAPLYASASAAVTPVAASPGGITYYVANAGNDSADGLTPSDPWKTIAKVNAAIAAGQVHPGDSILLNGGDIFRDDYLRLQNQVKATATTTLANTPLVISGTAGHPITISSYGTGHAILDAADPLTLTWTHVSGTTYQAQVATLPSKLFVDCPVQDCPQLMPVPNARGDFSATETYHFLDMVSYAQNVYVKASTQPTPGVMPGTIGTWVSINNSAVSNLNGTPNRTQKFPADNNGLQNVEAFGNGSVTVYFAGGTGYADTTPFTSTGGGTACTVAGTVASTAGVPSSISYSKNQGCTSVPTILLGKSSGKGLQTVAMVNPGSWYVTGSGPYTIYVNLPDGSNPAHHTFEGTNRPYGVVLESVDYVTISNLTFEHQQKSGILSYAYTDSTMGGSYFTNEYNTFANNFFWNYGDIAQGDSISFQTHLLQNEAAIVIAADGALNPHYVRGNSISGNKIGTMDAYFGIRGQTYNAGIMLSGIDGGGNANYLIASHDVIATTNARGIVFGLTGIDGANTELNKGGSIAYETLTNNQGNIFFGATAGGRVHHNLITNSFGEGIQLGGSSTSTIEVPQIIDHNIIANIGQSASTILYNGIDCNGVAPNVFEINNTLYNTNSAGPTFETGCTTSHFHNNIVDQNAQNYMPDTPSATQPNGSYLVYFVAGSNIGMDWSNNVWSPGANTTIPFYSSALRFGCSNFSEGMPDSGSTCTTAPIFTNPSYTVNDFSLVSGSPAIHHGIAASASAPFATPDSGAIPYGQKTLF